MTTSANQAPLHLEPPDVYLADTGTAKGRGVFARRDFAAGELVEECPVLLLSVPFWVLPQEIQRVVFNWGALARIAAGDAVALGYGSMYNHDNPANLTYQADPGKLTLKFIAVRPIRAGEELTINYNSLGGGPTWDEKDNHWFVRMNVQPVTGSP
jgi:hypothetical protein